MSRSRGRSTIIKDSDERKKQDIGPPQWEPTKLPLFPFAVTNMGIGDIRHYRPHGKHHEAKAWREKSEKLRATSGNTEGELFPRKVMYPYLTPRVYLGLPIPMVHQRQVYTTTILRSWNCQGNDIPVKWCLCVNDAQSPQLLVLFPANASGPKDDRKLASTDDVKNLIAKASMVPDLRIETLYVWRELVQARVRIDPNATNRLRFLRVPEAFVIPTEKERRALASDSRFADGDLPRGTPFSLVYNQAGLLLYMRHSYSGSNRPDNGPWVLLKMRGCTWKKIVVPPGGPGAPPESRRELKTGRLLFEQ